MIAIALLAGYAIATFMLRLEHRHEREQRAARLQKSRRRWKQLRKLHRAHERLCFAHERLLQVYWSAVR